MSRLRATLEGANRRRRRPHPDEKIGQSLRVLKLLRDAEWMVSHDWGGNRDEILKQVDELLEVQWAKKYLKEKP